MTRTRPDLVHPTHVSETMSNQYPTSPPPGPANRPDRTSAASLREHLARALAVLRTTPSEPSRPA